MISFRTKHPSNHFTVLTILVGCAWSSFLAGRRFHEILIDKHQLQQQSVTQHSEGVSTPCSGGGSTHNWTWLEHSCPAGVKDDEVTYSVLENESLTGGIQLLIYVANVDSEFLDSEERLAQAMLELIAQTDNVEMLSYHCYRFAPGGVSCVGMLNPGSVVTLHTWSEEGVLSLDIYLTGNTIPTLESVRSIFGIPSAIDGRQARDPHIVWSQKRRGFTDVVKGADLSWGVGTLEDKFAQVARMETSIQTIDIADPTTGRFGRGITTATNQKGPVVYMDSNLTSRRFCDLAYHEALVHPALFAHSNPRRVVIVGGTDGATLREVLKHNTVEEAIVVETDGALVQALRQHPQEWSSCNILQGSTVSLFDDPRVKFLFGDAISWFQDRLGYDQSDAQEGQVDVIIWNSGNSSMNASLVEVLSKALGDSGIFVTQWGMADSFHEMMHLLEDLDEKGFESVVSFEESHDRLDRSWSFAVALKAWDTRSNWWRNSAEVDYQIYQRTLRTKTSELPLNFFDGATMVKYQTPSRQLENAWCQKYPHKCQGGHGFDPDVAQVSVSMFEVKTSDIAKGGRGVFAKQFIPKGSVVALDDCVHGMFVHSTSLEVMKDTGASYGNVSQFWSTVLEGYLEGYGWVDNDYGMIGSGVDPGIMTFVNHGCDGKNNVGATLNETEASIEFGQGPTTVFGDHLDSVAFNPFAERHFPMWDCAGFVAHQDIEKGEEILDNYIIFGGTDWEEFESNLAALKTLCSGGIGKVFEYEEQWRLGIIESR